MTEQRIIIVSTGRNGKEYLSEWFHSINCQTYSNYKVFVVDDNSNDGTAELLRRMLHWFPKLVVEFNNERQGIVYNKSRLFFETMDLNDEDIIVTVDMDDSLFHDKALQRVNTIFSDENVWFSYGHFNNANDYVNRPVDCENIRKNRWTTSHLRASRWFLLKNILAKDLCYPDGRCYELTEDLLFTFPIVEMAGASHLFCNREIIYKYRKGAGRFRYTNAEDRLRKDIEADVRSKTPYDTHTREELIAGVCDWNKIKESRHDNLVYR